MPVNRLALEGELPIRRQLAWFEPECPVLTPSIAGPLVLGATCAVAGELRALRPAMQSRTGLPRLAAGFRDG
jgi:hypothetical protein